VNPVSPSDQLDPIQVDARGMRCPLPVIRLAEAARDAPAGVSIVVLASDPAARYDIAAWCRMRGHELVEMADVPDVPRPPETPIVHGSPGMEDPPAERESAAYLRFVVLIRP
jgi:tRNA 2-thiouridine synthesizing protein A